MCFCRKISCTERSGQFYNLSSSDIEFLFINCIFVFTDQTKSTIRYPAQSGHLINKMENLFYGQAGVHVQNYTRTSRQSKIAIPGYYVKLNIDRTSKFSTLRVDVISPRDEKTLDNSHAEFRNDVEARFVQHLGQEKWHMTKRWLTLPPQWTCIRICPIPDMAETVRTLQLEIDRFNNQRPANSRCKLTPYSRMPNCYKLEFASCILESKDIPTDRVIVDSRCGEAVLRGADVFAPGIKGATAGLIEKTPVSIFVDLDDVVLHGDKDVTSNPKRRLLFVGTGISLKNRTDMLIKGRSGLAIAVQSRPTGDSPSLNDFLPGKIYLQNLPSMTVGIVLDPKPGEVVLDMCCSPGGKTSHLADLMNETGIIVACDRTVAKCIPPKQCCDAFARSKGVKSIVYVCQTDSSKQTGPGNEDLSESSLDERSQVIKQVLEGLPSTQDILLLSPGSLPRGIFDRVLLDGPCSALGLRPRFSHIDTDCRLLDDMASVQKRMLFNALLLVKKTGYIVYSTCTINPSENEEVVKWFMDTCSPYVVMVKADPIIGGPGLPSILGNQATSVQRFDPSDPVLDTTGFFIAKFQKVESVPNAFKFPA